jgi:hypothetical protein
MKRDEIALRKQLATARSALYRVELQLAAAGVQAQVSRAKSRISTGLKIVSLVRTGFALLALFRRKKK